MALRSGDAGGPSSLTPVILHLASHAILARISIPPIPWPMTEGEFGAESNDQEESKEKEQRQQ